MRRNKLSNRGNTDSHNIDTLIGEHAHFHGELNFEGAVRIDGKFEGNIRSHNDGTLIVSETALIEGEVDVPCLILHGAIRGNVRAGKSLQISTTGRLNGDVEYAMIALAEGAAVNGRCTRIEDKEHVRQAPRVKVAAANDAKPSPQAASG